MFKNIYKILFYLLLIGAALIITWILAANDNTALTELQEKNKILKLENTSLKSEIKNINKEIILQKDTIYLLEHQLIHYDTIYETYIDSTTILSTLELERAVEKLLKQSDFHSIDSTK